jgi:hypothetical protein
MLHQTRIDRALPRAVGSRNGKPMSHSLHIVRRADDRSRRRLTDPNDA